jgi:hypothetical protein
MSMKDSNDAIGNRSRDLPVCSAVPQPLRHRVPHIRKAVIFNSSAIFHGIASVLSGVICMLGESMVLYLSLLPAFPVSAVPTCFVSRPLLVLVAAI